jgi:mRNA interferase RelE/StbE
VTGRYELGTAPPARRALAELLPHDVAVTAIEFITGPLLANPQRVGRPLGEELSGIYSARLAREWRVLYEIDEQSLVVVVLDIRHRSVTYRRR